MLIQRYVRGHLARVQLRQLKAAREEERMISAVVVLQHWWRSVITRREFRQKQAASLRIQASERREGK